MSISAGDVVVLLRPGRRRANMAHIRQSRPDSGLGVQVKVLETFQIVPSSLRSGLGNDLMAVKSGLVCTESRFDIHIGRAQYKRLDASVLI